MVYSKGLPTTPADIVAAGITWFGRLQQSKVPVKRKNIVIQASCYNYLLSELAEIQPELTQCHCDSMSYLRVTT